MDYQPEKSGTETEVRFAADGNNGDNGLRPYDTLIDELELTNGTYTGALYAAGLRNSQGAPDPYDNATGQADQVEVSNKAYGVSLTVDVVEYTEGGVRRQSAPILPGTSYVPVRAHAGVRALLLVYRVRTGGAPEGQVVRLRPAEWRPHRFLGSEGEAVSDEAAGSAS